ncbi:DUF2171 domain-containing protein [Sphingomonas sp. PAMC 26617]|uniref:DUF2171 domain-containing protein n=1 Tax=Sphingomonas sp. PAMC 26617 TaxID=1112216 RepID=UPI000287E879|nr:DUF2171 domain-containing protein [Sphingomonas sp. PAMC 26617]
MVDERYSRPGSDRYDNRERERGYSQSSYGDRSAASGRDYGAARYQNYGIQDDDQDNRGSYGNQGGYDRDRGGHQSQGGGDHYGANTYGDRSNGRGSYGGGAQNDRFQGGGSYGNQGRNDYGRPDMYGNRQSNRGDGRGQNQQGYGRQPQGYDYDDRGFFDRAGDEVRSWFGDDEASRRRDADARFDEQRYSGVHDEHYGNWRRSQIDALDRDYHEYREENRGRFESEFGSWRTNRQTQRSSLSKVTEHMDVVGSDGGHVGKVDKVSGDRIILTKTDTDAGGRHHSIPSSWLQTVDDKVTISKTAEDAKAHWRDEERNKAFFGEDDKGSAQTDTTGSTGPRTLNKSFGGTY